MWINACMHNVKKFFKQDLKRKIDSADLISRGETKTFMPLTFAVFIYLDKKLIERRAL